MVVFQFNASDVMLRLCGGCAGEATAFAAYGPEAECTHDWPAIRERVRELPAGSRSRRRRREHPGPP